MRHDDTNRMIGEAADAAAAASERGNKQQPLTRDRSARLDTIRYQSSQSIARLDRLAMACIVLGVRVCDVISVYVVGAV